MSTPPDSTALQLRDSDLRVALQGAVSLWAAATTGEGERRQDLLRDKQRIVLSFFRHAEKLPGEVEPADVQGWLGELKGKGISAGTVYQHACLLSSFYSWALEDTGVGRHVRTNPARIVTGGYSGSANRASARDRRFCGRPVGEASLRLESGGAD